MKKSTLERIIIYSLSIIVIICLGFCYIQKQPELKKKTARNITLFANNWKEITNVITESVLDEGLSSVGLANISEYARYRHWVCFLTVYSNRCFSI